MMSHDVLDIIRNGQIPFANPLDDTVNPSLGLHAEIDAASSLEGCRMQKGFRKSGLTAPRFMETGGKGIISSTWATFSVRMF